MGEFSSFNIYIVCNYAHLLNSKSWIGLIFENHSLTFKLLDQGSVFHLSFYLDREQEITYSTESR